MIIDTDVFIWYLRGHVKAKTVIENAMPFSISSVTYMELMQGMRDNIELRRFQKFINNSNIGIIHINNEISARAVFYVQQYALSHNMMMADALIAATVVQHGETLMSANDKHYKFIPNIDIVKFVVD